jgi:hypothetical protein
VKGAEAKKSTLTWEPKPSLNEVIAAQVQSLAGAIFRHD